MTVLQEALRLLTQAPGDLVFFLVTLFALQQGLTLAVQAGHLRVTPFTRRWRQTWLGLLLGRVLLMGLALAVSAGWLDGVRVIPPLERALEALTVLLFLWALGGVAPAAWHPLALGVALIALVAYSVYDLFAWSEQALFLRMYTGTNGELIWELLTLSLLAGALLVLVLTRPPEWEWGLGLVLIWAAGHGLQLFWPDLNSHTAGWVRLAQLVYLPLMVGLASRQTMTPERQPTPPPEEKPGLQLAPARLEALIELLRTISDARDVEAALIVASSRLADWLAVPFCAIGLVEPGTLDHLRVPAIHPPTAASLEAPVLDLSVYPTLHASWTQGEAAVVLGRDEALALYGRMGMAESLAPLGLVPLVKGGQPLGMLFLGVNRSSAMELARLVAPLLADAIAQGREKQKLSRLTHLQPAPDAGRQEWETERQTLLERLAGLEAQQEALRAAEAREKILIEHIAELEAELRKRQQEVKPAELAFWQNEVRELARDRDTLIAERQRMAQQLVALKQDKDDLEEEVQKLKAEIERLKRLPFTEAQKTTPPEVSTVGLLVADDRRHITLIDATARRLLRLPPVRHASLSLEQVYADPRWLETIAALLSPEPQAPRRAHLALQIEAQIVEADLTTLLDRQNKPVGVAVTLWSEESLAEQHEALVGMVNEFRNPMTAIIGYTDLLLKGQSGPLTELQRQFLERIKANIEQMGHLLNDMLSIVAPRAETLELKPGRVELEPVVEQALEAIHARLQERQLSVQLDIADPLPPLKADRDSLYQVLVRLLANAALCSEPGSQIVLAARTARSQELAQPSWVRVSITDTGGGIAADDIAYVFRRFHRAGEPLIHGMGETGIGMALAKMLVEAQGGRIWVDAEPGKGSTFSFTVPVYRNGA